VETSAELRRLVEQFKIDSNETSRGNRTGANFQAIGVFLHEMDN
jgi:hypothetical protein